MAQHRAVAVLCGLALLLGACSSGDSGDDATEPTSAAAPSSTAAPTTTSPEPASARSLPTTIEPAADLPGYNVYRPVDLDATGVPAPVVVWANGGCVRFDGVWQPLFERWAEAGFVTVAITTLPGVEPGLGDTTAEDQALAIDWAAEQNETPDGPYEGRLDLDRVVAAGNSCGGITSVTLARQDPRVTAVFVLSGSSVLPGTSGEDTAPVMAEVHVPSAWVVGGPEEDIAYGMATQDFELLPAGVPGAVVNRGSGDHPHVSTDPAILADVAGIGLNWMDLALYGTPAALAAFEGDPCGGCEAGPWTVQAKDLESLVDS